MRLHVPVSLFLCFVLLAASADAQVSLQFLSTSLRTSASNSVASICAEIWATRNDKELNSVTGPWENAAKDSALLVSAAERTAADAEKDLEQALQRRDAIEANLANLTGGRDTELARLEDRDSAIRTASAKFDGIVRRRNQLLQQLENPDAPVQGNFDLRQYTVGNFGGTDRLPSGARSAEVQRQIDQANFEIKSFASSNPVFDPIPAADETSIRAALARRIVDSSQAIAAYWKNRGGDPARISKLTADRERISADIDTLRAAVGIAREQVRIAKGLQAALRRLTAAVKHCADDQRGWFARGGTSTGETPPAVSPTGGISGTIDLECEGVRRTGKIIFRASTLPTASGTPDAFTSRLTWSFTGGPSGALDGIPGLLTPEGGDEWSTAAGSTPSSAAYVAVMKPAQSDRKPSSVRGMLCGPVEGLPGHCRGQFWGPGDKPAFEQELVCPTS